MTESHSDKIVCFFFWLLTSCYSIIPASNLLLSSVDVLLYAALQGSNSAKNTMLWEKKKKHCPNCLCFIVNYPLTHSLNDPLRRGNNGSLELTVLLFGMKICHKSMFGYLQMSTIIYMCTFQNPCVCVCLFFYLARAYGVCLWEVSDAGNQELSGGLLPRQTVCVHSVPG